MSDQGEREERIERGRRAVLSASLVEPFLQDLTQEAINEMVRQARSQLVNHDKLMLAAGTLNTIELLRERLGSEQRQGDTAAEKEYGNAKGT